MSYSGIELVSPAWLLLYPALLVIAFLWKKASSSRGNTLSDIASPGGDTHVYHPLAALLKTTTQPVSSNRLAATVITWLAMGLLVVALAQPERVGRKLPDPLPQRDIVFIVDTSVSMTLRDYIVEGQRVSRMTVVKGVLDEFVQNLKGSHLSVVVFGEHAYTYVPLTADHDFVRNMFSRMETTMAGRFNAIGDGVALAVRNSLEISGRHTVLVLLTDADRATGTITPENAALLARQAQLPLYTIAIGAATGAAEEKRTSGLIYQPVNLDLLSAMSEQTGAKSYRAGAALLLRDAISDIERREQRKVEQLPRFYREPLYSWLLIPALMLIGLYPVARILTGCGK